MDKFQLNSSLSFGLIPPPPAQRLPFDALYHLFGICMEQLDDPRLGKVLTRVCSSWRFAAIYTPTLWKYVRMECTKTDQLQLWPKTQLTRGRLRPVVFELFTSRDLLKQDIDVVLTHAHRFKKLTVQVPHPLITSWTMKNLAMTFPILEEFVLKVKNSARLVLSRNVSPNDPFCLPLITRDIEAKWEHWSTKSITNLSFMHMRPGPCPTLSELRTILESCSRTLQHFKFYGLIPEIEQNLPLPVTLPNLQSLSIGYADDIYSLVQLLHAPSLKSLELRDLYIAPDSPARHQYLIEELPSLTRIRRLLTLFTNAFPDLTSLELWGIQAERWRRRATLEFLASIPKLRRLVLYGLVQPDVFEMLFEPTVRINVPPRLFPQLSELMVSEPYGLSRYLQRRVHAGWPKLDKLILTSSCLLKHQVHEFTDLLKVLCRTTNKVCVVSDPARCDYSFVHEETLVVLDRKVLPAMTLYTHFA